MNVARRRSVIVTGKSTKPPVDLHKGRAMRVVSRTVILVSVLASGSSVLRVKRRNHPRCSWRDRERSRVRPIAGRQHLLRRLP